MKPNLCYAENRGHQIIQPISDLAREMFINVVLVIADLIEKLPRSN